MAKLRYRIEQCDVAQARVGPAFVATKGAVYFRAVTAGRTIARGAVLAVGKTRMRLLRGWTDPECREQGVGSALVQARMQWAWSIPNVQTLEVRTDHPKWWHEQGWRLVKILPKHNITYLELDRP